MAKIKEFLKKKDIQLSAKRYGIDALGAMAQGLFCTLLVGTILNTIGQQFGIDILVEMPLESDLSVTKDILANNGYICMSQSPSRASFNKGYTENGFAEKVFHLHIRRIGDHDELYFRDYLIDHPDIATLYEEIKLKLWKQYEHDRDGYTAEKTEFVQTYTTIAKATYKNRYEGNLIQNT